MKNLLVSALLLLTGTALAQHAPNISPFDKSGAPATATVTEKLFSVSGSDVYCSGFITKQVISRSNFVAGGVNSPYTTRFIDRDLIFLEGKYQAGNRVSIIRETRNPDPGETYPGTQKLLSQAGQPYADIGYARVIEIRNGMAVAQIELACDSIVPGDLVVPFVDRPAVVARPSSTLDRFPDDNPSLAGKIVMLRDYSQYAASGSKVFINIGWEKGVKCGDYFRVTRTFSIHDTDAADAGSFLSTEVEDTQKNPPQVPVKKLKDFPRRVVGEIIILNATPTSATGMVTFSFEEIHAGDTVELEPAEAEAGAPGAH